MTETNWGEMSARQLLRAAQELGLMLKKRPKWYACWLIKQQPFFGRRSRQEYVKFRRPVPYTVQTAQEFKEQYLGDWNKDQ